MTPMKRANTLKYPSQIGHPLELVATRRAFSVNTVERASSVHSNVSSFITDESEINGEPISVNETNGEPISVNETNTTPPSAEASVSSQESPLSENRKV